MGTVTGAEAVLFSLFESSVAEETVTTFVKVVPSGVAGGICAVKVKSALAPAARLAMVQLIVPLVPAGGVVQLNAGPLFCVAETKVIPAGSGSLTTTLDAASGPMLVTTTSNATSVS